MATTAADPSAAPPSAAISVAAGDRVFVDTNALAYATTPTAPFHAQAVDTLDAHRKAGAELWASQQILREYIATLTRPQTYAAAVPVAQVIANVRQLQSQLRIAPDSTPVFAQLLTLLAAVPCGGRQVYDANIVATMLVHGVPNLLTHNTADFVRFSGYIAIIPLAP